MLYWFSVITQLIFLEGILSIDNAAVLGAMAASLPNDQAICWPIAVCPLGRWLDPLLGTQRKAALKVGLLGAYLGRGLMLLIAHLIVQNPWLQLLGGGYLIYLGASHLARHNVAAQTVQTTVFDTTQGQRFWKVVLTIELADLVFSLDNVVAAFALSNQILIVLLGVAVGILAMRFAAGVFATLVEREPILESAAYILILAIGVQFLMDTGFHVDVPPTLQLGGSLLIMFTTVLYAHWTPLRRMRPLFRLSLRFLQAGVTLFENVVLCPVGLLASLLMALLRGG